MLIMTLQWTMGANEAPIPWSVTKRHSHTRKLHGSVFCGDPHLHSLSVCLWVGSRCFDSTAKWPPHTRAHFTCTWLLLARRTWSNLERAQSTSFCRERPATAMCYRAAVASKAAFKGHNLAAALPARPLQGVNFKEINHAKLSLPSVKFDTKMF